MKSEVKDSFNNFLFTDLITYLTENNVTDYERKLISDRATEIILGTSTVLDVFTYFKEIGRLGIIDNTSREFVSSKFEGFIKGLKDPIGILVGPLSDIFEDLDKYIIITDEEKEFISERAIEHMKSTSKPIYDFSVLKPYFTDNILGEIIGVIDSRGDTVIEEMCGGNFELYCDAVRELMDRESVKPSELSYLGEGYYSKTYGVGDKVVKVSRYGTQMYEIPRNSKRFLQPLVRLQTRGQSSYKFEVYEKVDTKSKVSLDELYEVYRDVRDDGMIWTDITSENVGRLVKDNKIHFQNIAHKRKGDEEKQQVDIFSGSGQGFLDENEIEILKSGEVVILDLDYIFPEDAEEIEWIRDIAYQFEERYKLEKEANKSKGRALFSVEDCLTATEGVTAKQQLEAMDEILDNAKMRVENKVGIER